MNTTEVRNLLTVIDSLPDGEEKNLQAYLILRAATDAFARDKDLEVLSSNLPGGNGEQSTDRLKLTFTEQEYKKMPKQFRKLFRYQGLTVRVYRHSSSINEHVYELKLRSHGYNIYASGLTLEIAKNRFIEKLELYEKQGTTTKSTIPELFNEFAEYFFENFYSRKVTKDTLRISTSQFKNHIAPHFERMSIKGILPKHCQDIIDNLNNEGKKKTADDIHSILNMIFKAAIQHDVITKNPMNMVIHRQHEREHGTPLTKDEEKLLLDKTAGTPQQVMFAVLLYTGIRPNESEELKIERPFIVTKNSKRKGGKIEYKKIPITPMLRPYLTGIDKIEFSSLKIIRDRFNKIFPDHRLYDLRTTFYTRCQECGVAPVARDEFVGHSQGVLENTYTRLSDEFLLQEGEKLKY